MSLGRGAFLTLQSALSLLRDGTKWKAAPAVEGVNLLALRLFCGFALGIHVLAPLWSISILTFSSVGFFQSLPAGFSFLLQQLKLMFFSPNPRLEAAFFVFSLQFLKYPAVLFFPWAAAKESQLSCGSSYGNISYAHLPLAPQPPVQALMMGLMSSSVFKWDVICRGWIFALLWIFSLLCHPHFSSFKKAVACWHSPILKFKK